MAVNLFSPLKLRSLTFKNRIVVSPMCEYSSVNGFANDWHFVHLGSRAVGGAALVFTEAAAVAAEGAITPSDLGIWKDQHIESLRRIFQFIEQQGAIGGMQLAHAGRKASTSEPWKGGSPLAKSDGGWVPIYGPSAVPFDEHYQTPKELSVADIANLVKAFADGARRAKAAGAKVVEIHAAHGYLLHSFLSPLANFRDDQYGGTWENRTRILREVTEAIRRIWPEAYPLFVRISSTDWAAEGWDMEQSVELAKTLKPLGVDLIDCSSGGVVPRVTIPVGPGYQVQFAERIRKEAGVPTAAVGMITEAEQANQIIKTEKADLVMLARELLRRPYWPLEAASILGLETKWPDQYLRARKTS